MPPIFPFIAGMTIGGAFFWWGSKTKNMRIMGVGAILGSIGYAWASALEQFQEKEYGEAASSLPGIFDFFAILGISAGFAMILFPAKVCVESTVDMDQCCFCPALRGTTRPSAAAAHG